MASRESLSSVIRVHQVCHWTERDVNFNQTIECNINMIIESTWTDLFMGSATRGQQGSKPGGAFPNRLSFIHKFWTHPYPLYELPTLWTFTNSNKSSTSVYYSTRQPRQSVVRFPRETRITPFIARRGHCPFYSTFCISTMFLCLYLHHTQE